MPFIFQHAFLVLREYDGRGRTTETAKSSLQNTLWNSNISLSLWQVNWLIEQSPIKRWEVQMVWVSSPGWMSCGWMSHGRREPVRQVFHATSRQNLMKRVKKTAPSILCFPPSPELRLCGEVVKLGSGIRQGWREGVFKIMFFSLSVLP